VRNLSRKLASCRNARFDHLVGNFSVDKEQSTHGHVPSLHHANRLHQMGLAHTNARIGTAGVGLEGVPPPPARQHARLFRNPITKFGNVYFEFTAQHVSHSKRELADRPRSRPQSLVRCIRRMRTCRRIRRRASYSRFCAHHVAATPSGFLRRHKLHILNSIARLSDRLLNEVGLIFTDVGEIPPGHATNRDAAFAWPNSALA